MIYYSAPNCDIMIRGRDAKGLVSSEVVIEQAYALSVNRHDSVMPYYSWSSRRVKEFVNGTILVQGTLIVNTKDNNYIQTLIRGREVKSTSDTLREIESSLLDTQAILESRAVDENGSINTADETHLFVDLARRRLDLLKRQNASNTANFNNEASEEAWEEAVDLMIIGPNGQEKDVISHVRFTGKSLEVNAGSASNIKYAFPFVARDATI